jgi:hypothetical protein
MELTEKILPLEIYAFLVLVGLNLRLMCCATIGELAQVLVGEEWLCQLLGSNPGKSSLSESQLLLVIQHAGSLGQPGDAEFHDLFLLHPVRTIRVST